MTEDMIIRHRISPPGEETGQVDLVKLVKALAKHVKVVDPYKLLKPKRLFSAKPAAKEPSSFRPLRPS
jgi:hypothetical protein